MFYHMLSDSQLETLKKWKDSHEKVYTGAIGGRYTWCFTPNNIGCVITVVDCVTKEELDLTDYNSF